MSGLQEYFLIFAVLMVLFLNFRLYALRNHVKELNKSVVVLAEATFTTNDCVRRLTHVVRDINEVVEEVIRETSKSSTD